MSTPSAIGSQPNISEAMKTAAAHTDAFLRDYIKSLSDSPAKLTESMEYSLFGPGKRIRPVLAILCCQAVGGTMEDALPAGAAVELIHCFSLVHDDLPAMDNDDLRRGRPTNHKVYGDALAILAGDAMNTLAFDLIATRVKDAQLAIHLTRELAWATGPNGMIGGQVLDTCHPAEAKSNTVPAKTLADLQQIHRMKTGALINAACRMGALAGHATPEALQQIDIYGKAIGLAFQIVDDILDVTATDEQMGKRTGKDANIGKLTYPSLLGMEASRKHLADQVQVTDNVVKKLGPKAVLLGELSHLMANRTN
jgi:geranylgeranyl diphosphate synthase, type II